MIYILPWTTKNNFHGRVHVVNIYSQVDAYINKGWLCLTILYKSTVPFDNIESLILTLTGLQ